MKIARTIKPEDEQEINNLPLLVTLRQRLPKGDRYAHSLALNATSSLFRSLFLVSATCEFSVPAEHVKNINQFSATCSLLLGLAATVLGFQQDFENATDKLLARAPRDFPKDQVVPLIEETKQVVNAKQTHIKNSMLRIIREMLDMPESGSHVNLAEILSFLELDHGRHLDIMESFDHLLWKSGGLKDFHVILLKILEHLLS